MAKSFSSLFPDYSRRERQVDAAVHILGVAGALGAVAALFVVLPAGDGPANWGAAVYGFGLVTCFGASAAYNLCWPGALKERLRRLDHAAIFLLIAGTYTPFVLVAMPGTTGTVLLAAIWTLAVGGLAFKLLRPRRWEGLGVALYLLLGWCALPFVGTFVAHLPFVALLLLLTGGLLYTAGVGFHLWRALPHHNGLWHAFVLAAAGCHYAAVVRVLIFG